MTGYAVYYRRTNGQPLVSGKLQRIDQVFATKAEAAEWATQHNSKPFTPFFFWTVEIGL